MSEPMSAKIGSVQHRPTEKRTMGQLLQAACAFAAATKRSYDEMIDGAPNGQPAEKAARMSMQPFREGQTGAQRSSRMKVIA